MPSMTQDIKPGSQHSSLILSAIRDRVQFSKKEFTQKHAKWQKAEDSALAYLPEREVDALRRIERDQGGKPQYTTIQIPYTYGILMASHTYWTTVFMSRNPIIQVSGRHG